MVVQHNLRAMNANRNLGITQGVLSKTSEKLSTGYKINRAADDAAGLSISEKMRKQIRGLTQASSNAEDGISSVQTAEGALQEVHDMLQRMNELATQAANGTNSESDRKSIQDEVDQLLTEIDRVAETTKFNETYLLKGNSDKTSSDMLINAHDAGLKGDLVDNGKTATFKLDSKLETGDKITIAGNEYTIGTGKAKSDKYEKIGAINTATVSAGDSFTDASTGKTYTIVDKAATADLDPTNGSAKLQTGNTFKVTHSDGSEITYKVGTAGNAGELDAKDAWTLIKDEIKGGAKVTLTSTGASNALKSCNVEIVDKLATGTQNEVSSLAVAGAATNGGTLAGFMSVATTGGITVAEGDSVTINGEKTTFLLNTPASAKDLADVISKLDEGAKITISRDPGNGTKALTTYTISKTTDVANHNYTVADMANLIQEGDDVAIGTSTKDYDAINAAAAKNITINTVTPGTTITAGATLYTAYGDVKAESDDVITKADALQKIAEELQKASSIGTDEGKAAVVANNNDGSFTITKGSAEVVDSLKIALHVGADADMTNKIGVTLDSMSTKGLGINGLNVKDKTGTEATYAIDAIADAIAKVSATRSQLGAVQNRLEHTIKNLDNVVENTTAAESQIRDTDMASEMVKYANANVLAQAGQSMLAQGNQANQGVLSLLG